MDWASPQNDSTLSSKCINIRAPEYQNINGGHIENTTKHVHRWTNPHVNPYLCRWADRHSSLHSCLSL